MLLNNQDQRYQPIDDWMQREQVSAGTLLLAERHGIRLPVWIPDRERVLVDTNHLYEWRELVRLMHDILELDSRCCGRVAT
jgi:hypothetical protein